MLKNVTQTKGDKMSDKLNIPELSRKYLNEKGQDEVTKYLASKDYASAKMHILDAVQLLWNKGKISDEESSEVFQLLGVP